MIANHWFQEEPSQPLMKVSSEFFHCGCKREVRTSYVNKAPLFAYFGERCEQHSSQSAPAYREMTAEEMRRFGIKL